MIKIGILISNDYSDFYKIQSCIHDLKMKFSDEVEIVQISDNYYHRNIKNFVIRLEMNYSEILRYDEPYTQSTNQNMYKFSKKKSPKWYYTRNYEFVNQCDGIFAFVSKNLSDKEPLYDIIKLARSHDKKIRIHS